MAATARPMVGVLTSPSCANAFNGSWTVQRHGTDRGPNTQLQGQGAQRALDPRRRPNALLALSVTRRLIAQFTRSRPRPSPAITVDLTARATEVWQLVAEGVVQRGNNRTAGDR
jgi:hypothetical protein